MIGWTLYMLFPFIPFSWGHFVDMYENVGISKCAMFKNKFANVTAQTALCFIKSSQPLRICSSCKPEYTYLKDQYDALIKGLVGVYQNTNCAENLLQSDATSSIHDLYDALCIEWSSNNCDSCYSLGTNNFTANFMKFLNMSTMVMDCFSLYTNASLDYFNTSFETIWDFDTFNETACSQCSTLYKGLNDYYNDLQELESDPNKPLGGLCGDMVDIMNTTRFLWSLKFNCDSVQAQMILVTPIFVILGFVLMFYCLVSTYFHNRVRTVFYKQRRLRPLDEGNGPSTLLETMK